MRAFCALCLVLALFACVAKDEAEAVSDSHEFDAQTYVPHEYILTTAHDGNADAVIRVYAVYGIEKLRNIGGGRFLLRLARDPGFERVRNTGIESGEIKAVQRNYVYRKQ
jgi:hypothetical protein